jgi:hypothetical protein
LPYVSSTTHVGRYGHPNGPGKFDVEKIDLSAQRIISQEKIESYNYGYSYHQIQMLGGVNLHNKGFHGEGMLIAILDAGFSQANLMTVFDSARANNQILATWNFVNGTNNVYGFAGHGSYTFSIIGANWDNVMIGTAPKANYLLLITEDISSENLIEEYNWAAGAEYADSAGADVISCSLGYSEFDDPTMNHTYADMNGHTTPCAKAANLAASRGIVVVNSAGNEGGSSWQYITTPADADSIISVGAVDSSGVYAHFSSTGPSSDGDVKPTVAAIGQGTYVADINNTGAFPGNGTSFSCPLIAGMTACLWQCNPDATYNQVIQAIKQSASQYSKPYSLLGYGIPDFNSACDYLSKLKPVYSENDDLTDLYFNSESNSIYFSFYSGTTQQVHFQIFDIAGKKVYDYSEGMTPHEHKLFKLTTRFANGAYILRAVSDKNTFARKFVRNK